MMSNPPEQYDAISDKYANLVKTDPQKKYVQYPSAMRLLGKVDKKRVLEIGCGSGMFARELALRGAAVTAYDMSPGQIAIAKEAQQAEPLNIQYIVSNPYDFRADSVFDKAVSVLVLHYASDTTYLLQFFASTHNALKDGGAFVTILANPQFKRVDQILYNRRFSKLGNKRMRVDFLDSNQNISISAEYSDFTMDDYETAATSGGFSKFEWIRLKIEEEGLEKMGKDYWNGFEGDCPYIGLIAH